MTDVLFLVRESINDWIVWQKHAWLPIPLKTGLDERHLQKTIDWLMLAIENGQGGVSSHYNPISGRWMDPFPETTGYIIPTLFDYAAWSERKDYAEKAIGLTDWLIQAQLDNGACMQGNYVRKKGKTAPIIFNTGQNILGFLRTFRETREQVYLDAANKAGKFLVDHTDDKGIWNQYLHHKIPHTYNSRTSWALLQLYEATGTEAYQDIARANLDWVVQQQQVNGWFNHCNFKPDEHPNTHGIAYTTRGLLESYVLTNEKKYLDSALLTAHKMHRIYEIRKKLLTFWDAKWKNHGKFRKTSKGPYYCLTGNIQFSIIWMKLFLLINDPTYASSAFKMLDTIKHFQHTDHSHPAVNGGIKGSFPIYGRYSIGKFPNWAAKFFADALLLKIGLMDQLSREPADEQQRKHNYSNENYHTTSVSQG